MKTRILVTFDMTIDEAGESKTTVDFKLPDHPENPFPENMKEDVLGQVKMLCGAMIAAGDWCFSEKGEKV